jgi:hypothetical protein
MSTELLKALRELKHRRQQECLRTGRKEIPKAVLRNSLGGPLDVNDLKNRHSYRRLEEAGLRRIFASLLIQKVEPLDYAKEQLEHSVDVYGHLVPPRGGHRVGVDKFRFP